LVTHQHSDHFDPPAIAAIRTDKTQIIHTAACAEKLPGGIVLRNGDSRTVGGIPTEAVPAYNLVHKRPNGQPFHIRGKATGTSSRSGISASISPAIQRTYPR